MFQHFLDCKSIVGLASSGLFYGNPDWIDWRYCYEGGRIFRERYLLPFSDRESVKEFERRRSLTPIPGYAQSGVDRVKNSLIQRLPDINRHGGTRTWKKAMDGELGGVDLKGSTMDSFLAHDIIPDMLVMGRIGTLVDAPELENEDQLLMADIPDDFRPFYNPFCVEDIHEIHPAPHDSPSDWSAILLEERETKVDVWNASDECIRTFRYFWLNPDRGNRMSVQRISDQGDAMGPPVHTNLVRIPFTFADIRISLMSKVCAHQIAMLNMISADTSNSVDQNFPIMVRQRDNTNNAGGGADHLVDDVGGDGSEVEAGVNKGIWYGKNAAPPAYINAPSEPLEISLKMRDDLKTQVYELIFGTLTSISEDGTIESGLASAGSALQRYENRLADYYTAYEETRPSKRTQVSIEYPTTWSLKTQEERIAEAKQFLELIDQLPGREGRKAAIERVYDIMFRGLVSTEKLEEMKKAARDAPFTTSNPDIIFTALDKFAVGPQTASVALGFDDDEWEKAAEERDRRAASMIAAQSDAANGAARGVPEGSVDPNSNEEGRAAEVEEALLKGEDAIRGEGQDNEDEEEDDDGN